MVKHWSTGEFCQWEGLINGKGVKTEVVTDFDPEKRSPPTPRWFHLQYLDLAWYHCTICGRLDFVSEPCFWGGTNSANDSLIYEAVKPTENHSHMKKGGQWSWPARKVLSRKNWIRFFLRLFRAISSMSWYILIFVRQPGEKKVNHPNPNQHSISVSDAWKQEIDWQVKSFKTYQDVRFLLKSCKMKDW